MEQSEMPYLSEENRLDMASTDQVSKNMEALAVLFPNCITETENGKAVDFDLLKQELNYQVIEGVKERYRLEWPGKREAVVTANLPTTKTLRPVREDSVNFDETENLYIEGDNLEVLKLLQESYFGKIKMIYIDPPYNTGNDFVYKDNFAQATDEFKEESGLVDEQNQRLVANPETSGRYHSDWLSMMYPRLKLARNLLTEDGVIFISIDDNEVHNLRKVCDEIFGEGNFIESIIWKKRYGGGAKEKHLVSLHEYILVYSASKDLLSNLFIPLSDEQISRYYVNRDENFDRRGGYRTHPLEGMKSFDTRENLKFPVTAPDGTQVWPKRQWRWGKETFEEALSKNEVEFSKAKDGTWVLSSKQYLKDENGEVRKTKPFSLIDDVFTQHGTNEVVDIFGDAKIFDFPKPSELILKLLEVGFNDKKNGTLLDFFSGSATTAHALLRLNNQDRGNRKFIMVQLPEATDEKGEAYKAGYKNICEIGKERIRRAGNKLQEELAQKKSTELDFSGQEPKQFDTGFRVYRLDSSNMQD
ncbi:site-specific DNA-methyltransferase, partial [Dyadobacter sp. BHUBP1]|uniref:site-specific DNA-methyltransferase n=1 Tax=Dyadobacter sp. BHUBP1 TaxID=3424178 RepID=UPI003D33405C